MSVFRRSSALVSLVSLLAFGCSGGPSLPSPSSVSGTIKQKGKPYPNVVVGFVATSAGLPANARYASAKTDASGKYTVEKIYPAEYQVTLTEEVPPPKEGEMVPANAGSPALAKFGPTSTLAVKVEPGTPAAFDYDIR